MASKELKIILNFKMWANCLYITVIINYNRIHDEPIFILGNACQHLMRSEQSGRYHQSHKVATLGWNNLLR